MSTISTDQRLRCRQPRPSWVPLVDNSLYTTWVQQGIQITPDARPSKLIARRPRPSVDELYQGLIRGDRRALAQAITLVESSAAMHCAEAEELMGKVLPHTGGAKRVGISGIPGSGKSTLIDVLGCNLCSIGHRVAVLAVDPSSPLSGGSILADKLRMVKLSREPNAFIRPSPAGSALGGVARKTREAVLLCEAAGYDVILIETVGVGQSEVAVRSMVDCFVALMIAGAGDDIQGIKKGFIEMADIIVITKADGDNRLRCLAAQNSFQHILSYLIPATAGWPVPALIASSRTGEGFFDIWKTIEAFFENVHSTGAFSSRRKKQNVAWLHSSIRDSLERSFYCSPKVSAALPLLESEVAEGKLPVNEATQRLLELATRSA